MRLLPISANVSGTPFQYVGVGYNLLDGNPEIHPDVGLLLNKHVAQARYQNYQRRRSRFLGTVSKPSNYIVVLGRLNISICFNMIVYAL